jgi:outer membrane receptor for Fe3+-dicitrate
VQAGSFDTRSAYATLHMKRGATSGAFSADVAQTDRYLDPPTPENYTNRGSLGGGLARLERDLSVNDRIRALFSHRRTAFLVPNDPEQQEAGQRQDRTNRESMLQATWERVLTPSALLHVRGMYRDLGAELWSNPLATPILADQDRGFREGYTQASVALVRGRHEWKAGAEFVAASVRERFSYRITDLDDFDDDLARAFDFDGRARSREAAAYVQDRIHAGNWTFSAGLRWDRYRFLVRESAWSPRLGVAWHWPAAQLVLRASYDRAFEVPPTENLLLSSSAAAREVSDETTGLPVPPSRGNFWQAGFGKALPGNLRLEAVWFSRAIRNFADDDVFLNTGVSFPISFARATIRGVEAKLELPRIGRTSGFVSWSNLSGVGQLPITGGLFLEEDAAELLSSTDRFPITQDQRNTVQARFRHDVTNRLWVAGGLRYGSGLPVELEGDEFDPEDQDPRILARVDLDRGRVRPGYFLDLAAGADFPLREAGTLRVQFDAINVTDQLNVINFAGLFSGNALAVPRSWAMRMSWNF